MPTFAISSAPFSAPLTPAGSEPEWRIALLTTLTGAVGALVISLVPAHDRAWPMALLLATAAAAWWRVLSAHPPPARLYLFADGSLRVLRGDRVLPADWLPGSRLARDFALFHWREAGPGGRRCSALVLRCDNARHWRRACLIWRWAPRRAAPRLGVDSAARGPVTRVRDATELSLRPRVYGGDRGRAVDE